MILNLFICEIVKSIEFQMPVEVNTKVQHFAKVALHITYIIILHENIINKRQAKIIKKTANRSIVSHTYIITFVRLCSC